MAKSRIETLLDLPVISVIADIIGAIVMIILGINWVVNPFQRQEDDANSKAKYSYGDERVQWARLAKRYHLLNRILLYAFVILLVIGALWLKAVLVAIFIVRVAWMARG